MQGFVKSLTFLVEVKLCAVFHSNNFCTISSAAGSTSFMSFSNSFSPSSSIRLLSGDSNVGTGPI